MCVTVMQQRERRHALQAHMRVFNTTDVAAGNVTEIYIHIRWAKGRNVTRRLATAKKHKKN